MSSMKKVLIVNVAQELCVMYFIEASAKPKFDHRSRIFELDPCDGYSKVCLVYSGTKLGLFTLSS